MGIGASATRRGHRLRWSIAATALATAVATGAATVGQAAPTTPAPVGYKVTLIGKTVQINVTNGTVAVVDDHVSLRNKAGADVLRIPLQYNLNDRTYPIATRASRQGLTLIPIRDAAKSTKADPSDVATAKTIVERRIRGPQTLQERNDQATQRFQSQVTAAMTVSTIIGMAVGIVIGVIVMGIVGCATIVACIPGILLGVSLGSVLGVIAGGGGSIIGYGMQYFNTINSPFAPQYYSTS